jgi:hypothetical protein
MEVHHHPDLHHRKKRCRDKDTTEYLLSTKANQKNLSRAVKNVKKGKTTKVDIDKYLQK